MGSSDQRSGGEKSLPEQVKRVGIVPPSWNAALVRFIAAGAFGSGSLGLSPPPQPASSTAAPVREGAAQCCRRSHARVPTATRYSCSKRASSGVPRFHSSQKSFITWSNSASRPSVAAFLRATIVGPYRSLKCSP